MKSRFKTKLDGKGNKLTTMIQVCEFSSLVFSTDDSRRKVFHKIWGFWKLVYFDSFFGASSLWYLIFLHVSWNFEMYAPSDFEIWPFCAIWFYCCGIPNLCWNKTECVLPFLFFNRILSMLPNTVRILGVEYETKVRSFSWS